MAASRARPHADAPRRRVLMVSLWASFLAACGASLVFFALFDPVLLNDASDHRLELTRPAGYALGFFFFWAIGAVACAIANLLTSKPR